MQISADLIEALAKIPRGQFTPFGTHRKNGVILLKFAEPAYAGVIDANPAHLALDNVNIYFIKSLTVFFAYALMYDNKIISYDKKYITIMRPSSRGIVNHKGVRFRHHDQNINVYESQDGCSLICLNNLIEVITPDMVRRKKSRET